MDIDILLIVKNKGGDTTDMNNYRAIAISNVDTKILAKLFWIKLLGILIMTNISSVLKQVIPQR